MSEMRLHPDSKSWKFPAALALGMMSPSGLYPQAVSVGVSGPQTRTHRPLVPAELQTTVPLQGYGGEIPVPPPPTGRRLPAEGGVSAEVGLSEAKPCFTAGWLLGD